MVPTVSLEWVVGTLLGKKSIEFLKIDAQGQHVINPRTGSPKNHPKQMFLFLQKYEEKHRETINLTGLLFFETVTNDPVHTVSTFV